MSELIRPGPPVPGVVGYPAIDDGDVAVSLHAIVWELLGSAQRSGPEDEAMVHAAHAACWHLSRAGGPEQWAVGEWLCARVYSVLGRVEPALHHADRCLDLCVEHSLDGLVLAAAHESLARALAVAGSRKSARRHRDEAGALTAALADEQDRRLVESYLATLPPL